MKIRRLIRKANVWVKNIYFGCRPHIFFGWLRPFMFLITNSLSLSKWMCRQEKRTILNDFFQIKRNYSKRYRLYEYVIETARLKNTPIHYLEFGVSAGNSIKWWAEKLTHPDNRFYGFDTFEGLPENWGTFRKGDMNSGIPQIDDERVIFIKGLFQETLPNFMKRHQAIQHRKVIHLDADLFSSTLYVLTSMAPILQAGDILFFDEFNVPNHEFLAFKMFTESYYITPKLIGAVNNYLQVAFVIQ